MSSDIFQYPPNTSPVSICSCAGLVYAPMLNVELTCRSPFSVKTPFLLLAYITNLPNSNFVYTTVALPVAVVTESPMTGTFSGFNM